MSTCIVTDTTAQFSARLFPGQEHVRVVTLGVQFDDGPDTEPERIKTSQFPQILEPDSRGEVFPRLLVPTVGELQALFASLATKYNEIVGIFLAGNLCPLVARAREAAKNLSSLVRIEIIDAQTAGPGLGFVVQTAAQAAQEGQDAREIRHLVQGVLPHVFSILCVRGLSYLERIQALDPSQATVGEMLGVIPVFMLEQGRLIPVQKIRHARQLVDSFFEFVIEFDRVHHLALVQGVPSYPQEKKMLRERIEAEFPNLAISEHIINPSLSAILGPHTIGVFVWEEED
ncbi:MAG TPA: DegV family protein [Anaerolineales bacterium]|nr:DegV family protein [Anaerolineales bacterium]